MLFRSSLILSPHKDIAHETTLSLLSLLTDIALETTISSLSPHRDIAKNSLLRWPIFIYWTCLGVFDAVVFFFGAYFLFDNTTFTSNGQVAYLRVLA